MTMGSLLSATIRVFLATLIWVPAARAGSDPVPMGTRRELLVDRYLVESMRHVRLALKEPRDAGPVLRFDKPWEGRFCGYGTVIKDGDLFRMYYRGLPDAGHDGSRLEVTCYAQSSDGIHWVKPDLGLFEVQGTRKNNVILANTPPLSHNFSPFLDANPDAKRSERFKALGGISSSGLVAFVSPDGIHWSRLRPGAVFRPTGWVLDSQNVSFWSQAERRYLLYYRSAVEGIRAIARTTSRDFVHWSAPEQMVYSDTGTTRPSQHLYTNQTQPYFRAPHIYLSTAARFLPGRQVLTPAQARAIHVHPKYFQDTSDSVLMTSRGGDRYDRTFLGALIKPGIGAENWVSRSNYPLLNLVQTGPAEMSLYVNQNYGQPTAYVRRYAFRLDGLSCATAGFEGGEWTTKPLRFSGQRLFINFATSAAGGIRVEIQDRAARPIPGFTLGDCVEVIGNEIEREVAWRRGADLARLAGKPVRLRFAMKDADLYAFRFAEGK